MLNLNYDNTNDVMYVSLDTPRPSIGDEIDSGIVLLKDFKSRELTGITIFNFKKQRYDERFIKLLPKEIDYNQLIKLSEKLIQNSIN